MANMMKLMKQAASMQKDMERIQAELAKRTVECSSGGGMVTATATADGNVVSVKINPQVINPAEADLLEDMVLAAVDGALKKGREAAAAEMQKVTAGLGILGLKA
jgi:DNA-binding YbaB/EbfC family protein